MPEQDNDAETRGVDEGRLFEALCEMTDGARLRELARLDAEAPALAARLRRLLAIDDAYGAHTARSVMPHAILGRESTQSTQTCMCPVLCLALHHCKLR